MEAESPIRLVQGLSGVAGHVHSGGVARQVIPAAGMIPSMGTLLAGFGMAPTAGIFLPGRPPAASALHSTPVGANVAGRSVWNAGPMVMAGQHQAGGSNNGERSPPPQHQKGPWTAQEDDILKEKVREHGERRWAVVARFLPGRIGKQCRERWTNHLRPDIRKSLWSEADDLELIQAHKIYGNRWSLIARCLPGRSENAVKNHWNATRRSLRAKRRLKKNKKNAPAPPAEQLSVLEEYIRALYPVPVDLDVATPPLPPVSPPPSYNLGHGDEVLTPPAVAAAGMGMMYDNLNSSGGSSSSTSPTSSNMAGAAMNNMDVPSMLMDLNAYYGAQVMMDHEHLQLQQQQQQASSAYANMMMMMNCYPSYVNNFMWQQQPNDVVQNIAGDNNANTTPAHPLYYGAGPSGHGGHDNGGIADDDDGDVAQMASREFLTPSEEELTLDLTKFK